MPLKNRSIAVIIPAYKAAATVSAVIAGIPSYVDRIVVVDDGSPDATGEAARTCGDPRVTVLTHAKNQGVGGAVLTGYHKAVELGCDILVKMDADGQMKPEHLPKLLAPLVDGRAQYAKGNRFLDSGQLRSMPPLRRLGNTIHSMMMRWATGHRHLFDATNGYTAMDVSLYRKLEGRHLAKGYFFETSLLFELSLMEAKIVDVDIPAVYEGAKSHIRGHHVTVKFPLMVMRSWIVLQYRRRFRRNRKEI